jgi:hypothetical protein
MMTERTTEQRAADEMLDQAILACCEAYGYANAGTLVTHWIVLVNQQIWKGDDSDGTAGNTGICMLYKDGDMPWMNIFGLIEMARTQSKIMFAET